MKMPKKLFMPMVIPIAVVWLLTIALVLTVGFDNTCKIMGFLGTVIGLPTVLVNLYTVILVLNEEKLINRTLIEAGKKDREKWEEMKLKSK